MHTTSQPKPTPSQEPETIHTTLYDLIAAVRDAVGVDHDALVVATVVYLLRSGRVRFLNDRVDVHVNYSVFHMT